MTYNVHSCAGWDGVSSPKRIARVIASHGPDIIAVQELDIKLTRSGLIDQAEAIAKILNMEFHFHPSLHIEEGRYGNAVMSRYPLRLVRAGALPTIPRRHVPERRGILWTEVLIEGRAVQIMNTHLGLIEKERLSQVDAILGPEWLGNENCKPPVVLCGDFNASTRSQVYKKIRQRLCDAQKLADCVRCTWPSFCPFLRIDHVFVTSDIRVLRTSVPRTSLAKSASDHLPLIVEMQLPEHKAGGDPG